VLIAARRDGGDWERGGFGRLRLTVTPGTEVLWYAAAIGPGGATLLAHGSEDRPRRWMAAMVETAAGGPRGIPYWIWIAGGAAGVALTAVLIAAIASAAGGANVAVGAPMILRDPI
jgi:hypothetical protein